MKRKEREGGCRGEKKKNQKGRQGEKPEYWEGRLIKMEARKGMQSVRKWKGDRWEENEPKNRTGSTGKQSDKKRGKLKENKRKGMGERYGGGNRGER